MLKICITHLAPLHHYHHLNVSALICFHTFAVLFSHHQNSLIIPTFLFFPNKRRIKKTFSWVPISLSLPFIILQTDLIGEFFANGFCGTFNMCWKGNHKTTKWCQSMKLSVLCSSQTGYNKLSMQLYVQYNVWKYKFIWKKCSTLVTYTKKTMDSILPSFSSHLNFVEKFIQRNKNGSA